METSQNEAVKIQPNETIEWLTANLKPTFDLVIKHLKIKQKDASLFFIKTVVDSDRMQQILTKPFFELDTVEDFSAYIQSLPDEQENQQVLLKNQ